MSRVYFTNVCLQGVWFPCEYQVSNGAVAIRSLGYVECGDINLPSPSTSLESAAENVLHAIPENRKLVVLIPQVNQSVSAWPWRQILKRALTESMQSLAA